MKAAILVELNKPLVVGDLDLPEHLSFGQVLVKVHYSGICGAQINEIEGAKGPDKFLPHLLGHEGSATVLDIGPGVRSVKKGDQVVMHWRPGAGLQSETPTYKWDGKQVNAGWVTTFNDRAVVSENRVTPIPGDLDLRLAPLFGCAVTTAMGVVNRDAQVQVGQSIVVFGVGGVGVNIVQAAALVSANPIVAIDIVESKLEWARRFGATDTLMSKGSDDLAKQVRDIVGAAGADVVVDTTGRARVIELAYELTHADGKTILVGVPRKGENISIYSLPLHFKKVLTGSHGGGAEPHVDIPRLVRLMRAGKLTLDGLVTHEFSLDQINDAIATVRRGEAGRVLLRMD
ncbi:MAG TPA: zinc-binding dehydrogenase [Vicinamibacterales bacterium]|nr:zinc-binding dehydrogenase [Vicinamibacterales bacterium]